MIQQYICIFSLFWRIKLLACLLVSLCCFYKLERAASLTDMMQSDAQFFCDSNARASHYVFPRFISETRNKCVSKTQYPPYGCEQLKICETPSPTFSRDGNIAVADCMPLSCLLKTTKFNSGVECRWCTGKNKNLAIANRSRVSCAHNTLKASVGINITP